MNDELLESLTKAVADGLEHLDKLNKLVGRKATSVSSAEVNQEKN